MPPAPRPVVDSGTLSAAFLLVFRQGSSPSSPAPDDTDLLHRLRDAVPAAPPAACREALIRVRRLSFDAAGTGTAFLEGQFGTGDRAREKAIRELQETNPGFTDAEYRTAFNAGLAWAGS